MESRKINWEAIVEDWTGISNKSDKDSPIEE